MFILVPSLQPVFSIATCGRDDEAYLQKQCLIVRVRETYLDPRRWQLFPDFAPSITELSARGWRHIILSNHVPELPELVRSLGIAGHFDTIFSSGITGIEKPNPQAFQVVIDHADKGAEFVMVGDSWASEALYLTDPDANGVELYWDRPQTDRPRNINGSLAMYSHPLDLDNLLAEPEISSTVADA